MAELKLYTLSRAEAYALHKRAEKGDEAAVAAINAHFPADDGPHECFLCGNEIAGQVFTLMAPDRNPNLMILAPTCRDCHSLPWQARTHRILKILREMYSSATGKQVHFKVRRVR